MWGHHEGMGWWWVFGSVWMVAFWAIVIGLVVWGIKQFSGGRRAGLDQEETPIEIAQRRLARGEISKEQFEEPLWKRIRPDGERVLIRSENSDFAGSRFTWTTP